MSERLLPIATRDPARVGRGLCQCGCGRPTLPATRTRDGNVKGEPARFLTGHRVRSALMTYAEDPDTGCWLWGGGLNTSGYAQFNRDGKLVLVHRAMYEHARGPIPDGLTIDHLCRVRQCVNPAHLEAVTFEENVRRGSNAKLAEADVVAIRQSTEPRRDLAARYGVTPGTISRIRAGGAWQGIELNADTSGLSGRERQRRDVAKLTLDDVRAIRTARANRTATLRELAERYGVSSSQIVRIQRGECWADRGRDELARVRAQVAA